MFRKIFIIAFIVVISAGLVSCGTPTAPGGVNSAPYDITGPGSPQQAFKPIDTVTDFPLSVDEIGGLKDPDGDIVQFRFEFVSQTVGDPADLVVSLNSNTGVFSISYRSNMAGQFANYRFWTEDPDGLTSAKFSVQFYYESN